MKIGLTNAATQRMADLCATRRHRAVPLLQGAMSGTATATITDLKLRMRGGGSGTVGVRSGRLRSSLGQVTTVNGSLINTLLGSMGVVYARIQEFGGTIRPKKGKYLAIPVGPALTAAGVARFGPRDVEGLFFIKTANGGLLVRREGKGSRSRLVTYFVLVTSATLKPKLGLRETIQRFFVGPGSTLNQRIKDATAKVMRG